MIKAITLIFPNGNAHALAAGQFSFDDDELLAKALEAGQRWITCHPNGPGTKGVPVMVQESQHGSGVYHVIGGAGGKLNFLKFRGLAPESSYKEQAAKNKKAKSEQKKVLKARDKELGIDKGKSEARTSVKSQLHQEQKGFIKTVADKMGWKDEDLQPNIPDTVSDVTRNKLEQRHHSALLEKAHAAVDLQHQNLLTDAMAREEAGGTAAVADEHTPDDQLTVADLDDSRPQAKSGLGFAAHYAERADAQGATEEVIKQEAGEKKAARQADLSDNQRAAIKTRGDKAQQIKAEIESIRQPVTSNVKAVLAAANDAVELIKAQKKLKAATKSAQAANKDIDSAVEVKAYNLEVSAPEDGDIADDLEADLRTIRTKAFLSAVGKETPDAEKQLRQHVSAGAFNSINALALTAGGSALVDRSVIDVLGLEGAARVLARRLHADLPADEMEKLAAGMEDWHVHSYMESSKAAMQEAQELHDAAKEIGLGEASHGEDFEAARELLRRKKDCIEQAHKILGTALGEMESNAALVTALKAGRNDKPLEVPLGKIADEDAIRQARAIGLQRGDYSIDRVAGNQVLTVTPEGLDRLSKPVDREELARTKNTLDILNGGQDEDDWLPQGFAKRPDLCLDLKPGVAATLARPFAPDAGNLQQSLRDYIGGRAADGDAPGDIVADIQSSDFFQKAGDADAYREALDAVAPLKGKDGKMARAESLAESFDEMADSFVKREYGGNITTLQRQQFEPDAIAQDALHRALADEPAGVAAYKPIGELSGDDQRALRDHFYANVAHESPEAAGLRARLETMASSEPEKESQDMFGETSVNPDWHAWKSQRDTLAEEVGSASLDWQKYASAMHGHENAYASIQDLIRSKVAKSFHENHNKLNPAAPLKLGRQVIRGNLNHLDAVDPEARRAREAKERELTDSLRERNAGKYASGSVGDKLDAERERRAAFEQSQMGFFSTEQEPDMFGDAPKVDKPLGADERYTLGHAAERTIAGMMPLVGRNFKPGQPLKLFNPTMSGPDGIMRQRAIKMFEANKRMALAAGTGCVYGGTILKCEETNREMSFYDWWLLGEKPVVKAIDANCQIVLAKATTPVFIKGYEEMFLVSLESGASVIVTAKHRFLKENGEWATLESLEIGSSIAIDGMQSNATQHQRLDQFVASAQKTHLEAVGDFGSLLIQKLNDGFPRSTSEDRKSLLHAAQLSVASLFRGAHQSKPSLETLDFCSGQSRESVSSPHLSIPEHGQLIHDEDGHHFCQTTQDSPASYSAYCRQCGEQPRSARVAGQEFPTLQDGVLESSLWSRRLGCLADKEERSHPCLSSFHPSTMDSYRPDNFQQSSVESDGESSDPLLLQRSLQTEPLSQPYSCSCCDTGQKERLCQFEHVCFSAESPFALQASQAYLQQSDDSLQSVSQHVSDSHSQHEMLKEHLGQSISVLSSYSPIVSAISCGNSIVFDITIGEYHNYFAHGIIHHNSGKTGMMLGAFSHLQSQGKAKRGMILCPSIVQGQMGAEALRFMEPGKFNWHCEPGASRDERIAAYKNPEHHFTVMTHQSFRDDMLHLGAQHAGIEHAAMSEQLDAMAPDERSAWMKGVMAKEGINYDFLSVDEGHNTLNRDGKENSAMANVVDSLSANTPYFMSATADVVKNDISEAADVLRKMDPKKHGDTKAFMRRFGVNTQGSKEALQREMVNYVLPFKIEPKVRADKSEIKVTPSESQTKALAELDKNIGKARIARMEGKVDVDAMKAISPGQFKDAPEAEHEAIAKELSRSLGIIKGSAVRNILDSSPDSAKIDALSKLAGERKGKPGVVFAHSLAAVENIKARLEKDGHRVVVLTGADSSADKAAKIRGFNPDSGESSHDILVASDAGATGANLQHGQWLAQFDTPNTAMTWRQRSGRIHRIGQKNDVELMDLIADHPSEARARTRLKTKDALRDLMSSSMEGLDDSGLAHFLKQRQVQQQNDAVF